MTNDKKDDLWWMLECPKSEPCYCKEECMYLRQKSKKMTEQQTTDREKKIAEIREALEKATQGQWKWVDPGGLERKKLVGEWEIMNFGVSAPYSEIAGQEPDDNDAHLIANAPEWLGFLLSELEKRDEENQKLRKELDKQVEIGFSFECQLQSAHQEIERLRKERENCIKSLKYIATNPYNHTHNDWAMVEAQAMLNEMGVTWK